MGKPLVYSQGVYLQLVSSFFALRSRPHAEPLQIDCIRHHLYHGHGVDAVQKSQWRWRGLDLRTCWNCSLAMERLGLLLGLCSVVLCECVALQTFGERFSATRILVGSHCRLHGREHVVHARGSSFRSWLRFCTRLQPLGALAPMDCFDWSGVFRGG